MNDKFYQAGKAASGQAPVFCFHTHSNSNKVSMLPARALSALTGVDRFVFSNASAIHLYVTPGYPQGMGVMR